MAYTKDIKDECDLQRITLEVCDIGFAVKRPPSSPDQGSLHKARCSMLLGPHHDLEEMPPAHQARFHAHWATFLCDSWGLWYPSPGHVSQWKESPQLGIFTHPPKHTNSQQRPEILGDSGGKGVVCKNNPAPSSKVHISSSACVSVSRLPLPPWAGTFPARELWKKADLILALTPGSRQKSPVGKQRPGSDQPLAGCVAFDRLLDLSEPQFCHL